VCVVVKRQQHIVMDLTCRLRLTSPPPRPGADPPPSAAGFPRGRSPPALARICRRAPPGSARALTTRPGADPPPGAARASDPPAGSGLGEVRPTWAPPPRVGHAPSAGARAAAASLPLPSRR